MVKKVRAITYRRRFFTNLIDCEGIYTGRFIRSTQNNMGFAEFDKSHMVIQLLFFNGRIDELKRRRNHDAVNVVLGKEIERALK